MRRLLLGSALVSLVGLWVAGALGFHPIAAAAKSKKPAAAAPAAAGRQTNACGCYADTQGNCFCGRKGKCDCPGECEPKGCEAKRAKQIKKEVVAETKKAAEADRIQKQRSVDAEKRERKHAAEKTTEKDRDSPSR